MQATRKLFIDQLTADLQLNGAWGYRLIRGPTQQPVPHTELANELCAQRAVWSRVWEEGRDQSVVVDAREKYLELCRDGSIGSRMGHVSVEKYRWAAWRYPAKKALGCDGWRAFESGSLPDDVLGCFVGCVNSFVDEGEFPAQLGLNIMAMLKKPQGGFRCVAKTPMWYRLFAFVRRSVVKEWELGMMGEFDTAAPGQQALDAALRRSLFW